jgi:hypothetical protein
MNGMLKNKAASFVLVLTVISVGYIFASDVTVQNGNLTAGGLISGSDLLLNNGQDDYLYFNHNNYYMGIGAGYGLLVEDSEYPILSVNPEYDYINMGSSSEPVNAYLYGTLFADYIGDYSYQPYAFLSDTEINGDLGVYGGLFTDWGMEFYLDTYRGAAYLGVGDGILDLCDVLYVMGLEFDPYDPFVVVDGDLNVTGTVYAYDFVEESYASSIYEQKSRDEIIEQVQKEVPPDKQNGAAIFFNKETKNIENYIASEGKFYDMQGNVVYELAEVVKPTTKYETVYHFNKSTGEIKSTQRAVSEEYQIKKEYSLDSKTGKFINKNTGQIASREEALEIYASAEGKIYDLSHNFLRDADKKKTPEITPAGNFNSSKNQIKTAQNNTENQEITVKPASSN